MRIASMKATSTRDTRCFPVVTEFVRKYELEDFIVVADSGLMNNDNIADLEANGYKYIIGAKIRNESRKIQEWILGAA